MAQTVRMGARGGDVSLVQIKVNIRQKPTPRLSVDGIFGPKTDAGVKAFQRARGLVADGIVGPKTHAALDASPALTQVEHRITHIPQPTRTTCWAASTAMMTRSNVPAVIAKTPSDMIAWDGGLLNSSESHQAIVTGTRYGNIHGLRCYAPMSWATGAFVGLIQRGPIMLDMLWRAADYTAGNGSPGHMVVIGGVISDGGPSGATTWVKLLDPWPPGRGRISWHQYDVWMREVPTRTYRVFERK
ncbi:peptidoglycan-binding protein [Pseudooceanicola sp. C21-150M6]|uniref:peptidoglycan-binding protein n=1 Tax=Pseudooceanicola sp. C21-150M6 TaxID=3434355 RepID=UPI003D7F51FE